MFVSAEDFVEDAMNKCMGKDGKKDEKEGGVETVMGDALSLVCGKDDDKKEGGGECFGRGIDW